MSATATREAPIQFRSAAFAGQLRNWAQRWGVSENQAALRLAALAANGLRTDDHDRIARMGATMPGAFAEAARVEAWRRQEQGE
jgi:hypothetical protein